MTCDNHAVVADKHRIDEPELGDRTRDLRNLILGVRPGVARMWIKRSSVHRSTASEYCMVMDISIAALIMRTCCWKELVDMTIAAYIGAALAEIAGCFAFGRGYVSTSRSGGSSPALPP